MQRLKQSGFGTAESILILVVILIIGSVGWFVYSRNGQSQTQTRETETSSTIVSDEEKDNIKVHDLNRIEALLQDYYNNHASSSEAQRLPATLEQVDLSGLKGASTDYIYKRHFTTQYGPSSDSEYQICATFTKDSDKNIAVNAYNDYERHTSGENCFAVNPYQNNLFKSKYGAYPYKE